MSNHANKANVDTLGRPAPSERSDATEPAGRIQTGSLSRPIARHWKLIAAITVATVGIAWMIAAMQPDEYRATALAAVAPVSETLEANEVLRGVEVLERRTIVATVAALAETDTTRTAAAPAGGYDIEAVVLPNTNLFRVNVQGSDGTEAAAIANRVPDVLSKQAQAMYKYYKVTTVSPAASPDTPFLPRTGRAIATGLLAGLFLGLLAAYAMESLASRRGSGA